MKIHRLIAPLAATTALLLAGCAAPAPTPGDTAEPVAYPDGKTITLVVPYAAGGPADLQVRIVADLLSNELDTEVIVENKPGGNTITGITEVANADPDGYTVGFLSMPNGLVWLFPGLSAPYGKDDLVPLAGVSQIADVFAVRSDSPFETVEDLVDAAKAAPDSLTVGVEAEQSGDMLAVSSFEEEAGVSLRKGFFPDGAPQKTAALLGGQIDVASLGAASAAPFVASGEFRLLAVLSEEPLDVVDAPTMVSLGYNVVGANYYSFFLPVGVPDEVRDVIEGAMRSISETDEFQERISALTLQPDFIDHEQLADRITDVEKRTSEALAKLG
jgi:tripartite-type tricarboxylate transporter receptor subunit TctC